MRVVGLCPAFGACTLSSLGAHSEALAVSVVESDRDKFFRVLFHDDRNSNYIIFSDCTGALTSTALKAKSLGSFQFDDSSNYYVTHHGFNGCRRLTERTRQLNAIFFDIDCHEAPSQTIRESLIALIQDRLADAVLRDHIPMPTIIVDSGRGVQLYYVFRRSIPCRFTHGGDKNEKGIWLYEDVQRRLADVLEGVVEGLDYVELDRIVFDKARVGRIPDTFNKKAGRCARLVSICEAYYDLSLLEGYCSPRPREEPSAKKHDKAKPAFVMRFNALQMSRLNKISELQEYRKFDCEGNRELMCFVYYNSAVQVYDREGAVCRLAQFNNKFRKPLSMQELQGVISSVDRVKNVKGETGYYVLGANKIIECLGLTEEEMLAIGFFQSKRMVERIEAKRKTKAKREARNELILTLYKGGDMTQEEVAAEAGCSVRTVRSVLKEAGITKRAASGIRARKAAQKTSLKEAARATLDAAAQVSVQGAANGFFIFSTMGKILAHGLQSSDDLDLSSLVSFDSKGFSASVAFSNEAFSGLEALSSSRSPLLSYG